MPFCAELASAARCRHIFSHSGQSGPQSGRRYLSLSVAAVPPTFYAKITCCLVTDPVGRACACRAGKTGGLCHSCRDVDTRPGPSGAGGSQRPATASPGPGHAARHRRRGRAKRAAGCVGGRPGLGASSGQRRGEHRACSVRIQWTGFPARASGRALDGADRTGTAALAGGAARRDFSAGLVGRPDGQSAASCGIGWHRARAHWRAHTRACP